MEVRVMRVRRNRCAPLDKGYWRSRDFGYQNGISGVVIVMVVWEVHAF